MSNFKIRSLCCAALIHGLGELASTPYTCVPCRKYIHNLKEWLWVARWPSDRPWNGWGHIGEETVIVLENDVGLGLSVLSYREVDYDDSPRLNAESLEILTARFALPSNSKG